MKFFWHIATLAILLAIILFIVQILMSLWLDAVLFPVFDTVVQHIVV
ncbi:hypothetical protein LJB77_01275 [Ruminococcaceae bacterium OttesenSCG-928-N02]|nr:hypothetical protein [Ruminococcaceae bacterium OttesenSCG-928-N02]